MNANTRECEYCDRRYFRGFHFRPFAFISGQCFRAFMAIAGGLFQGLTVESRACSRSPDAGNMGRSSS